MHAQTHIATPFHSIRTCLCTHLYTPGSKNSNEFGCAAPQGYMSFTATAWRARQPVHSIMAPASIAGPAGHRSQSSRTGGGQLARQRKANRVKQSDGWSGSPLLQHAQAPSAASLRTGAEASDSPATKSATQTQKHARIRTCPCTALAQAVVRAAKHPPEPRQMPRRGPGPAWRWRSCSARTSSSRHSTWRAGGLGLRRNTWPCTYNHRKTGAVANN